MNLTCLRQRNPAADWARAVAVEAAAHLVPIANNFNFPRGIFVTPKFRDRPAPAPERAHKLKGPWRSGNSLVRIRPFKPHSQKSAGRVPERGVTSWR